MTGELREREREERERRRERRKEREREREREREDLSSLVGHGLFSIISWLFVVLDV
jgi:hypothetical protein